MCGPRNVKKLSPPLKISLPPFQSYGHLIAVTTLFSDKGEGVCLKAQSHLDNQKYITAYGSHKFDATKERWHIVEKKHTILLV